MDIIKNLTTQNYNAGTESRIKYIVVHYTGNNGDTALSNTNYFKSYRGASAHYFVDENSVYQSIEDKNIAWHCGTTGTYYHPECRNHNSIGVELCSYINSKGKYDFKEKTIANAISLINQLMAKYNIPLNNVIRHYDVTKKMCPEPFVRDNTAWVNFKKQLAAEQNNSKPEEEEVENVVEKITVKINGKEYKANRILNESLNYICIQDLEQAGFDIGYDVSTKVPSISSKTNELKIHVDDEEKTVESILLNGRNYVQMRELADAVGNFSVEYTDNQVIIKTAEQPKAAKK